MDSNEPLIRHWHLDNLGPLAGKGGSQGSGPSQDLSGGEAQPCQEHNPGFVRVAGDRVWASALWGPGPPHKGGPGPGG
jgi:hypothetical protein